MAYLPVRQVITLDTGGLEGDRYRVSVYDPAECRLARRYEWPNTGSLTFIPEWDLDCFVVLDAI
jgi:hypothetical protein